jgi:hypothetical protein
MGFEATTAMATCQACQSQLMLRMSDGPNTLPLEEVTARLT